MARTGNGYAAAMPTRRDLEGPEQEVLAAWLDAQGLLWCHCPNEGQGSVGWRAKQARRGLKAGVPDVLVFSPVDRYAGAAVELKPTRAATRHARVSAKQRTWLDGLRACGWATAVCHGADEAIAWLVGLGYAGRHGRREGQ